MIGATNVYNNTFLNPNINKRLLSEFLKCLYLFTLATAITTNNKNKEGGRNNENDPTSGPFSGKKTKKGKVL